MPDPQTVTQSHRLRIAGGLVAAGIAALLGVAGYVGGGASAFLLNGSLFGWLFVLGAYGVPIGLVVGWWLGPRSAPGAALGLGVRAALACVVLGTFEVSLLSGLRDALTQAQPIGSVVMTLLMLPAIGLVVLGLPAFLVLLPATVAWAVLMGALRPRLASAPGESSE